MAKLYMIPTTLGETSFERVLPSDLKELISSISVFIVENIRTARRFLKKVNPAIVIDDLTFFELNQHTDKKDIGRFLEPHQQGLDIGIISEAGCPGIADPGADVVRIAHTKDIQVVPLVGPSSILLALMASGMSGQNFAFNGYLPVKNPEKSQQIKMLERRMQSEGQTQVFIEAPYRNLQLLDELIRTCDPQTLLCIAADITLDTEFIRTKPISFWKSHIPDIQKRPAIFLIGRI
ncbi:MAG TPA: SAM-dependent methyltransferase [Prolixibacteraceae bacterium]|nr:SAM-dependent methyltransferase [Prolixibacteraceae bacterium]